MRQKSNIYFNNNYLLNDGCIYNLHTMRKLDSLSHHENILLPNNLIISHNRVNNNIEFRYPTQNQYVESFELNSSFKNVKLTSLDNDYLIVQDDKKIEVYSNIKIMMKSAFKKV